jgi:thioredoxin-related protein
MAFTKNRNLLVMRKIGIAAALLIFVFTIFSFGDKDTNHRTTVINSDINWMTWEQVQEKIKKEPRKVVVDVYTEWCGWCKKMDASTFQQEHIANYLNENYYAVKFDAEYKEDIEFNGKTYKFVDSGRRGYHQLAAEITNGRLSFPTLVFLDENLDLIQPIPGFKDPLVFEQIVTYFAQDMHKRKPWSAYQRDYKPMPKIQTVKN